MRIEIRTATEITSVSFPSITDASLESAVFFIENGWTESAKRVIANMAHDQKEMAEYALGLVNDLNEVIDSETENANYWRGLVESRTSQLDIMREANEKLVKDLEMWKGISADQSEMNTWYYHALKSVREDRDYYRTSFYRLEKAFAGISKGYGRLKRAFNAHTRKINAQIKEINALSEMLATETAFSQKMMDQNAELIERLSNYESI